MSLNTCILVVEKLIQRFYNNIQQFETLYIKDRFFEEVLGCVNPQCCGLYLLESGFYKRVCWSISSIESLITRSERRMRKWCGIYPLSEKLTPARPIFSTLEARVQTKDDLEKVAIYELKEGDTYISTESAILTCSDSSHHFKIPETLLSTPVKIRIQVKSGQVVSSKLLFSSKNRRGLRLMRRYGVDEVPVGLRENINTSTDSIHIDGNIVIKFQSGAGTRNWAQK